MDPQASPPKTSGLAITSLVLGILSLLCCGAGILMGIPAVITGFLAVRHVKRNPETQKGAGLGLAGLIMGCLSIAMFIVYIPMFKGGLAGAIAGGKSAIALTEEKKIFLTADKTGFWPADAGITSGVAYVHTLVDQKGLDPKSMPLFHIEDFEFGNVNRSDSGKTIFARTRPGTFTNGWVAVFYKDGTGQIFHSEAAVEGTPPAREPAFLAP